MGLIGDFKRKREQRKLAEQAERDRLQRDTEAREKAQQDRAAARQADQDRLKQQEIDRANLPQKRQIEAGAAETMFADKATKDRMRLAAQPGAQPEQVPQQDQTRIATEREARLHPTAPAPTIGPGGISRTAVRESLGQKLARERAERAAQPAPVQTPDQSPTLHPKPEIVRLEDRLLTKEQLAERRTNDALKAVGDDLKAKKIDRVTALDRELRILTRPPNENTAGSRTLKQDYSKGRNMTDES